LTVPRPELTIEVLRIEHLRFHDGAPVRAASAIVAFGDGWLVAQDDSNHAAWHRPGRAITRLRLFPSIDGFDSFSPEEGTKHLKPDIEVACRVDNGEGTSLALLLGSGSTVRRMRTALVRHERLGPVVETADLTSLYRRITDVLGIDSAALNIEGAAVLDGHLYLFSRGIPAAGLPSQSVVIELAAFLNAWPSPDRLGALNIDAGTVYDFGTINGVALTVTDAVAIGNDRFLLSAAAEDTPNAFDDGPVVGSALALADSTGIVAVGHVPRIDGVVAKVEGLAVLDRDEDGRGLAVLAVVDADNIDEPSMRLQLAVRW
jgi:hypothetical protein